MAQSASFVYVSNSADNQISSYRLEDDGHLQALAQTPAPAQTGPLAVSPDQRFLYAAGRAKPPLLQSYAVDPATGALTPGASVAAAESFPYISMDRSGRYLFGASYGANLVSVNAIEGGVPSAPARQVIPTGRNAHAIAVDASNRFVFVPTLGTDALFQFRFDATSGTLTSNTPALVLLKPGTGPRHFAFSPDNRFVFALGELLGTVTTFALDGETGLLSERSVVSALPPDTPLQPGGARLPSNTPGAAPRDTSRDVWAADIHVRPDGRFLYVSERTTSSLSVLSVDPHTGALNYLASVPTQTQPRGFAIDASGRFLVASGEKSMQLAVYRIDPAQGTLSLLGRYPTGAGANWVQILRFD